MYKERRVLHAQKSAHLIEVQQHLHVKSLRLSMRLQLKISLTPNIPDLKKSVQLAWSVMF